MIEALSNWSSGALFSECGEYRYRLWRDYLCPGRRSLNVVMLNPSTADETVNDPTVTRCINRAKAGGFSTLYVTNIFALRSTDPKELYRRTDPIGPLNDRWLLEEATGADQVAVAWGAHGAHLGRSAAVVKMLRGAGVDLYCWALTKAGEPRHPLYLPARLGLEPYLGTADEE